MAINGTDPRLRWDFEAENFLPEGMHEAAVIGTVHIVAASGLMRALDIARAYGIPIDETDESLAATVYDEGFGAATRLARRLDEARPRQQGTWFEHMLSSAMDKMAPVSQSNG